MSRRHIRLGFRAGAKAVQRSVNDCEHSLNLALKRGLVQLGFGLWVKAYTFLFFTKQLQDAFQRVSDESAQQKEALHALKQKESKATNMVTELTAVRFLEY